MLLNRVSLQGFLAHRGQEQGGEIVPNELDFRDSNLWLMHGANGSGKSSIFDAITFALFDKARGSQLLQLVNDRSDSARVEVELEAGGERYLVRRHLKLKKKRDGHQMSSDVLRWNAQIDDWEVVKGITKVRDWATETLQVSYENFVSAVVLEQGRADQFLRAAPRARREQLMELLDLKVYEELSSATNARRTLARRIADDKEKQFANCTPISPDEVEAASAAVEAANQQLEQTRGAVEAAQKKAEDALLAAAKEREIADKNALLRHDEALTGEAKAIEGAAARREEIGAILPALGALRNARRALIGARQEWEAAQQKLEAARARERELAPMVEEARAESERAGNATTSAQLRAREAELAGKSAASDAESLRQIENWEAKLAACQSDLAPHRETLKNADAVEARSAQIDELTIIAGKIRPLGEARKRRDVAQKRVSQTEAAEASARESARKSRAACEQCDDARQHIDEALEQARAEKAMVAANLKVERGQLKRREDLGDDNECPTCGTVLDDPDARERLQAEREILRREVAQLETRAAELEGELQQLDSERKDAMRAQKAAQTARDEANQSASKAEAQLDSARHDVEEKTREWEEYRAEAGEWAEEDFDSIKERINSLGKETIAAELAALQAAQRTQDQSEWVAQNCRAQLEILPDWNADKRAHVREAEANASHELEEALAVADDAQKRADAARKRADELGKSWDDANNQVEIAVALESAKVAATGNAERDLDEQIAHLSPQWNAHAAAAEDGALDELRREFEELQTRAARLAELRQAQQRVSNLQSVIAVLRKQLNAIPTPHRVAPDEAKRALDETRSRLTDEENVWETAKEALARARGLREKWANSEAERDAAQTEAERYRVLAEAFGRDGLQAKIIRQAQQNLRSAANGILGRLSKGQWQLDLVGEDDSELEIIARDEGRGGYARTFDALSGGERFRVAISLAIAIGQMASGGAPMNTLVIDEGFGALDEENRGLMVDNLRHLSEHELKGGRIIVVSHQDDVRDAFGYRYQLSRDELGYAKVEMTVG